jgi:hypothetical protein
MSEPCIRRLIQPFLRKRSRASFPPPTLVVIVTRLLPRLQNRHDERLIRQKRMLANLEHGPTAALGRVQSVG